MIRLIITLLFLVCIKLKLNNLTAHFTAFKRISSHRNASIYFSKKRKKIRKHKGKNSIFLLLLSLSRPLDFALM